MKIAILILAHSNQNQLKMLIDSLKQDFSVFVHIDAKSDISLDFFEKDRNVTVFKKHRVYWGDENMIYAILDLLKMAYNAGYDYFILISGLDLPIKSNAEIIRQISENPHINYIFYEQMPRSVWTLNGGFDRLTLYWESLKNRKKTSFVNFCCSLLRNVQRLTGFKRKLMPLTYFGGSTWINISREVAAYILDYTGDNPKYIEMFKYTRNADEIYFHTIILNSKFASNIINDDKRYVDWTSGPEYPRTLTMDDYDKIMQSDALFARKFDEKRDDSIITKINCELNREKLK